MKKTLIGTALCLAVSLITAPCHADTIYTYTGNDLCVWYGGCTGVYGVGSIDATLTLAAPIQPDTTDTIFQRLVMWNPKSGFTLDTNDPQTQIYNGHMAFTTDANGAITMWDAELVNYPLGYELIQTISGSLYSRYPVDSEYPNGFLLGTTGSPGTWSCTSGCLSESSSVPEPGTYGFALIGLGLLGLMRKRIVPAFR